MNIIDSIEDSENKLVKVNYWSGFDIYYRKCLIFSVRGLNNFDKTRQ